MVPPPPPAPPGMIPPPPPQRLAPPPPPREREGEAAPSGTADEDRDDPEPKRKRVDTYYDGLDDAGLSNLVAKDDLTVMIRSLHPRTGEFDLFELFSTVGKVNDVKMISDERNGKSLGVAYVEMADEAGVNGAFGLNGHVLSGNPILVQRTLALKNRLASKGANAYEIRTAGNDIAKQAMLPPGLAGAAAAAAASAAASSLVSSAAAVLNRQMGLKIYVGGLDFAFTDEDLQQSARKQIALSPRGCFFWPMRAAEPPPCV